MPAESLSLRRHLAIVGLNAISFEEIDAKAERRQKEREAKDLQYEAAPEEGPA